MKTIGINYKSTRKEDIDFIVGCISEGDVIVYPTDTIYGLGCIATSEKAINKIFKIKKIKKKKPLIVLMNSFSMIKKYCYISQEQGKHLKKIWPGPVTVVLKSRGNLPKIILDDNSGVAVRLPKNKFLITIIKRVNKPLISTSFNITGQETFESPDNLDNYFVSAKPDLVIDAGAIRKARPSKLVDLRDPKKIIILRK